jgi:ABC-type phosphate/phosphonate transport system substrate-binding protein
MLTSTMNETATTSSTADSLVFAIPNRKGWEDGFRHLCEFLASKLQKKVKLVVGDDFDDVQKLLQHKRADFGIFTSTSYVQTKNLYRELRYIGLAEEVWRAFSD